MTEHHHDIKDTPAILFEISGKIATITLNRPQVHNAFNETSIELIIQYLSLVSKNTHIRALVLTHTGNHFCAGADLNWMKKISKYSFDENHKDATLLGLMFKTLFELPIPTIAVVRGHIYGGGIGLVAACKITIASQDACFCFSEAKLGLIPATIAPYIVHAIGPRQTLRYFLTAQPFNAQDALQIGLCHEVVGPDKLNEKLEYILDLILKNGPEALTACIHLVQSLSTSPISDKILNDTVEQIAKIRVSTEGQAGIQAFLEKRTPDWI